jgi:hypothetical protein
LITFKGLTRDEDPRSIAVEDDEVDGRDDNTAANVIVRLDNGPEPGRVNRFSKPTPNPNIHI